MTVKKILAVYSGVETDNSTMSNAFQVAQGFGAHITAIYAVDASDVSEVPPEVNSRALLDDLRAQEQRNEEETYANFNSFVKREGLDFLKAPQPTNNVSVSWETVDSQMQKVVARRGGAFDLIVIGQPADKSDGVSLVIQGIMSTPE